MEMTPVFQENWPLHELIGNIVPSFAASCQPLIQVSLISSPGNKPWRRSWVTA